VADIDIDLSYNAEGLLGSIQRNLDGNVVATSDYTYDSLGRLTGLVYYQGATVLESFSWSYSGSEPGVTSGEVVSGLETAVGGSWLPGQNILPVNQTSGISSGTLNQLNSVVPRAETIGWIIPVPAVPEKIEKATPGVLKTLDFCIQPRISHDLSGEVRDIILAVLAANFLSATWIFKRKYFVPFLLLLVVLFLLMSLFFPALATLGAPMMIRASTTQVEKTATVGSYTISVLRPSKADGLNNFLRQNGFSPLPERASQTIAEYIAKTWGFAAIKLTRGESGANTPHPIKIVFPSKEAVYPLKLTATAGGKPGFELFVIAKDRASCDMLEEEFCDHFSKEERKDWPDAKPQILFSGTTTRCDIGHPAICSLMWDGCVLTKFVGTIESARMIKDIQFTWKPFKSRQEHIYTQYGAGCLAAIAFVLVVGSWNIILMGGYARGLGQRKRFEWYFAKRLPPAIVMALVIASTCFALVHKLGNSDIHVYRQWTHPEHILSERLDEQLVNHSEVLGRTRSEIAAFFIQCLRGNIKDNTPMRNVITGAELKEEDSPGNFTVEKKPEEVVVVRVYDRLGRAIVKAFPASNKNAPR
jgi:hypothetical protein